MTSHDCLNPLGPIGTKSMIAFAGLPSSGKSSTAKALGRLTGAETFLEPEESVWPDLVRRRDEVGLFTALTWFRSARVPHLYAANNIRASGKCAIVDSYYDVLVADYIGHPAFHWLIDPADPYFAAADLMVRNDWALLPKADTIVFLSLDEPTWLEFMRRRDRDFDRTADLDHHFEMQKRMLSACKRAVAEHGGELVTIQQQSSTPEETARRVLQSIRASRAVRVDA